MNDSPGWATPGSSPSDGEGSHGTQPPAGGAGDSKWSAEQPPPGQWSSPTPGQTPPNPQQQPPAAPQPGAGWGSYGSGPQNGGQNGGQGGWGRHTQAAKPGVIPLRPLGLGEILDGAVSTMRKHWRTVLPITLVVAVLVQLVSVFVQKYALEEFPVTQSSTAPLDEQLDALGSMVGLMAADQFILFIGTIVATAMLTMVYSRAVLGHGSSVGAAWREARTQLARLFGLTLLLGIGASSSSPYWSCPAPSPARPASPSSAVSSPWA